MKEIDVSVILSAYNEEERWFREAVESIINQSYENFEFILILDNPNNTLLEEIINEYCNKDNRIVYIKNEKNLGLVKSLNKGLEYAKGKYIARMDADDIANVDRLKKQYEFMEANKDIDLIGTSVDFIDENNCIIQKNTFVVKNSDKIKDYLKCFLPSSFNSILPNTLGWGAEIFCFSMLSLYFFNSGIYPHPSFIYSTYCANTPRNLK